MGDKVDFGLPYCYKYKEWSEESTEDGWKGEQNISSENAYSFRIDRLRADGKVLLTDTTFDMKEYLTEADSATADVRGVFYDGENGYIYIPVSSVDKEYTWRVEVPTEKAENYTVTEFAGESNWFGLCYRLGDFIYLNGGAGAIPIAINPATRELRTCALEYEGATEIAQKWIKENQPSWRMHRFSGFGRWMKRPMAASFITQRCRKIWTRIRCLKFIWHIGERNRLRIR